MKLVFVDTRRVASETAHKETPIIFRDGREGEDTLCTEAEFRIDGRVIGRIGYWPERVINMHPRNEREVGRGVTIWVELEDGVTVEPVR